MKYIYLLLVSIVVFTTEVMAIDQCEPKSSFSAILNSGDKRYTKNSSVYHRDESKYKVDIYHITIEEAGALEITLKGEAKIRYGEGFCPYEEDGQESISKIFNSASEVNLIVYSDSELLSRYQIDIRFLPSN